MSGRWAISSKGRDSSGTLCPLRPRPYEFPSCILESSETLTQPLSIHSPNLEEVSIIQLLVIIAGAKKTSRDARDPESSPRTLNVFHTFIQSGWRTDYGLHRFTLRCTCRGTVGGLVYFWGFSFWHSSSGRRPQKHLQPPQAQSPDGR